MNRSVFAFLLLTFFSGAAFGQLSDSLQSEFNSQEGIRQIETGLLLCGELEDEPEQMLALSFRLLGESRTTEVEPLLKAKILKTISDAYYFNDSIDKSVEYLDKAITLARTAQFDSVFVAGAYNDLGLNYIELEENRKALQYLEKSVEMFRLLRKPDDLANALSNLATVYYGMGQFDKAIGLYNEVYQIDLSTGNVRSQSSSLNNLGRMYIDWGKYETGIEFYKRSLALLDTVADREILGLRYNNIGLAYQKMGQHSEAINWIRKALQVDDEENNKLKIGIRQFNLATSYLAMDDFTNARYYLEQAEDFFVHLDLPGRLTRVYGEFGELYRRRGDLKKAESYYLKAEVMAERAGTIPEKAIAGNYLYRYYKLTGQPSKALKYFEQYTANNDSIYKLEAARQVEELEKIYQTEKKENEIQRLESENEIRSHELVYRKRERNLALTGLVLLFFFSASVWFLFRRVRSQKRELAGQNDELDRLNKTLNHLFGIISHDLRNATAAYQSSAKIIGHHLANGQPEKLLPLAPEIGKNARQLSVMLENLLNWSAIQIKGIQPEKRVIRIKPEIEKVILLYEEQSHLKNDRIVIEMNDEEIWIDPESFNLIIRNLVHNAIKFTSGGEITVKAFSEKGSTCIEITDTGCGIDSETMGKLKQQIHPETQHGTAGEKGTGLGLLMVAGHVEKNGGTIQMESTIGKGTTVCLTFPNHKP